MMIMGFIRLLRNRRNKVSTVMVTNIRIKRLLNLDKNEAILIDLESTRKKDVRITTGTSFLMTPPHHLHRNTVVRNGTTIVTRSTKNRHKDTKGSLTSPNSKETMYYKYLRITTSKRGRSKGIKNRQVIRYF